jgi:hypothetical protein
VTAIRAVMATYALSGLPLICTEVGNQETYSANGLRPMGDAEKALWMARSLIYLALAGCSRVVWYSYDGPNYVGSDGKTRRYGLIDSITKADTAQNVVWRSLAAILPGANIQRINRNNASGELHITTSAGSGRF